MVLAKVGASVAPAITAIFARASASAASKAGPKSSSEIAAKGGRPNSPVQSESKTFIASLLCGKPRQRCRIGPARALHLGPNTPARSASDASVQSALSDEFQSAAAQATA